MGKEHKSLESIVFNGLSGKFVSQLLGQQIFRAYYEFNEELEPTDFPHQRLVCRNNSELYYTNKNYVRCATIGPNKSGFKILKLGTLPKIRSLLLNSSESMLAVIGKSSITVALLPNSLPSLGPEILVNATSYHLTNIDGNIVKCLWHTSIAKDSSLVVLTDKMQIQCFDISYSTSAPTLHIDLTKFAQFKGVTASSITFGSQKNLIGSLTLYVGTSDAQIYALYPFVPQRATLATTKEDLEEALQESISILRTVEDAFPYSSLVETANSYLKSRAISQYEYFENIKKQLRPGIPEVLELRRINSDTPYNLILLEQHTHSIPHLQGPIFAAGSDSTLSDIHLSFSNAKFTSLVSIVHSKREAFVHHHAQLKPLLMEWKDSKDNWVSAELLEVVPRVVTPKKHGYAKPKKGFGYVNLSDEEDEEASRLLKQHEKKAKLKKDRVEAENKYMNEELKELSTLSIDVLSCDTAKGYVRPLLETEPKIILHLNDQLIIGDTSKWANELEKNIQTGNESAGLDFESLYQLVTSDTKDLIGAAFIRDVETGTGDYLFTNSSKFTDNITVTQIDPRSQDQTTTVEGRAIPNSEKSDSVAATPKDYKEPIEEIIQDLGTMSNVDSKLRKAISKAPADQKIIGDIRFLENINSASNVAAKSVSTLTSLSLRLYSRIFTQVDEMQSSIKKLDEIKNRVSKQDDLKKTEEGIKRIQTRQQKIDARLDALENKLQGISIKARDAKALPLSSAEKVWFRELNSMTSELNVSSPETLSAKCENVHSQATALINVLKESGKSSESINTKLKELEISQKVMKLRSHLEEEQALIENTKVKLESSFKELKI